MQNKQEALEMQEKVTDDKEKISIIKDENGKSIVIINDIRFIGKQHINWEAVREYLKEYVGHASDKKLYLYDMVNVKKEKETEYPA